MLSKLGTGEELGNSRWVAFAAFAVPTAIYVFLATRFLFDEAIGYPDADRLLMDGVFIADVFRDMPFFSPLEYALVYFAQYPALSIGYKPPFFPLIESFFVLGFGEHVWAGRLSVIAFGLVGGAALFLLVRRMYGQVVAGFSTALLASLPFIAWWSWFTMTEIPVLAMVLLAGVFVWRLSENGEAKWAYLAALAFAAAVWTKQSAVFAILWFLPVVLASKHRSSLFTNRQVWIAGGLFVIAILPIAALTVYLGDLNLGQSIGDNPRGEQLSRLHPEILLGYLTMLVDNQASWAFVVTALVGLAVALQRPDRRLFFWAMLAIATYVVFTLLNDPHEPRYTIFWLPAVAVLAALPVRMLPSSRARVAYGLWLSILVIGQTVGAIQATPQRSSGFQEAANLAVEAAAGPVIFIDAYNNGYFTFFVRAADPERRKFVVRGDKVLSSSAVDTSTWVETHVDGRAEIRNLLDRLGVEVLVLEERNYMDLPVHDTLRELVKTEDFELLAAIPIDSTLRRYEGQSLFVYRYLDAKRDATSEGLTLRLPIIGKQIFVPSDGSAPSLQDYSADP
jgi:hypothetical protein